MEFKLTGKLIVKGDTQQISDSFKKRELVIEVENERNSDWNDFIKFQLTQDNCDILDSINLGDKLSVSFNIRGRKWEKDGKTNFFSNLEAWRIEKLESASASSDDIPPEGPDETDDLPF